MATYGGLTYANGHVPAAVLAPLDGQPEAQLRRDAADAWNRGRAAVHAATGIVLEVRGWNRTLAEQERFFHERYEPQSAGGGPFGDVRWYQGTRYVRLRGAAAAIPGTSNHGLGLAVDVVDYGGVGNFGYPRRTATFPILARHGWTDDEGRGPIREPWHLVYNPDRDTHPPEDDMFTDEDRALLKRAAKASWVASALGGTNALDEDGERKDPSVRADLNELLRNTRRAERQITALTAAVETLATSSGLDPQAVTAAINSAVEEALADLKVTLTTEAGDE